MKRLLPGVASLRSLSLSLSLCVFTLIASEFMPVTLIVIPAIMAAIAAALIGFGMSLPVIAALLGVWGLLATSEPVGWWSWLSRTMPRDAEAGGGLMIAVVQLAITVGATVGGVLFDASGYQATFGAGAVLLVIASGLAAKTAQQSALVAS